TDTRCNSKQIKKDEFDPSWFFCDPFLKLLVSISEKNIFLVNILDTIMDIFIVTYLVTLKS
ncbi:hypothetical protein, partial [Listeria monocytogenes]|uniref:hypothetical protein n=1 Tax=Listeria monocytogenes TaxID=1639 RepID=UPI001C407978